MPGKAHNGLEVINLKDQDVFRGTPTPAPNGQNPDRDRIADTTSEMTSTAMAGQDSAALGYPMSMPGAESNTAESSSAQAAVTDNGEFEPVQTNRDMSIYRDTGEPGSDYELPSDTIS
ncbi:hypothetical protein HMPREF0322_02862 [Desulfitobacterium hafniense DP7]|uniref:Uncharacterized protein n=1 Tax=Desulfitobacterium hafniense DP7 TaxID=537010 RepID=G9XPG6_DESHA|nr:hypothetical protein [Desulfitobacterium hafniense]EHL06466.1 hypothetical protein HMPREF0322_02862 [Desulfitobacterium hafniense DP7]